MCSRTRLKAPGFSLCQITKGVSEQRAPLRPSKTVILSLEALNPAWTWPPCGASPVGHPFPERRGHIDIKHLLCGVNFLHTQLTWSFPGPRLPAHERAHSSLTLVRTLQ